MCLILCIRPVLERCVALDDVDGVLDIHDHAHTVQVVCGPRLSSNVVLSRPRVGEFHVRSTSSHGRPRYWFEWGDVGFINC